MYLSKLNIDNYRLFNNKFEIEFNRGLTVLAGENGSGKSTVIDAIRFILAEDEYGKSGITASDFYRPIDKPRSQKSSKSICFETTFVGLNEREQVALLTWLDPEDSKKAKLHLKVDSKEDYRGRYKKIYWGGDSTEGIFEYDLLNSISCIYLPPLRDAEEKLGAFRGSKLARLLKNLRDNADAQEHPLEIEFRAFNNRLLKNHTIVKANQSIKKYLKKSVGPLLCQDSQIQFAEIDYDRIVERLKLLFYPTALNSNDHNLYRDLSENSLGYNNIIYIATILAELECLRSSDVLLKLLLIEEPEAHLHPQLQKRLLQYLQKESLNEDIQIVLTSHSPTIAASVNIDSINVVSIPGVGSGPISAPLSKSGISIESKYFLERWLDITKSTLLFSRGVILVEGIAEALLIPELAKIIIKRKYADQENKPESLDDFGVSVINMGGIYFEHFMQLFKGYVMSKEGHQICSSIPIRCAGITDCDPDDKSKPTHTKPCKGNNKQLYLCEELKQHSKNCRLFSNLRTLEYDLAFENGNLKIISQLLYDAVTTNGPIKRILSEYIVTEWEKRTEEERAEVANQLLEWISSGTYITKGEFAQILAYKISNGTIKDISIPEYIREAILWAIGHE